jgi:hypothetical protein
MRAFRLLAHVIVLGNIPDIRGDDLRHVSRQALIRVEREDPHRAFI